MGDFAPVLTSNQADEEEEERKRKARERYNYIVAAMTDKMQEQQKKEMQEYLSYINTIFPPENKAPVRNPEEAARLMEAARSVHEQIDAIDKAKVYSEKQVDAVAEASVEDKAMFFKTRLIAACHKFATSKSNDEAAKLGALITNELNVLKKDPELMDAVDFSSRFMNQLEMIRSMTSIIRTGLESLEQQFEDSAHERDPELHVRDFRLNSIMRMQVLSPSDVLKIKSPEIEALENSIKPQEPKVPDAPEPPVRKMKM